MPPAIRPRSSRRWRGWSTTAGAPPPKPKWWHWSPLSGRTAGPRAALPTEWTDRDRPATTISASYTQVIPPITAYGKQRVSKEVGTTVLGTPSPAWFLFLPSFVPFGKAGGLFATQDLLDLDLCI